MITLTLLAQVPSGPTLAGTVISVHDLLAPWIPTLFNAFMGLVLALLGWIAYQIKVRTGVAVEASHMQVLQKAIENGAGAALARLTSKAKTITVDVRSEAVRAGVEYVNQSAAQAVAEFGLTPEQLAEKIIAKMSVITAPNPDVNIRDNTPPPPNAGAGG